MTSGFASCLCFGQGAYYALTGLWSLVDLDSFQAVTGPKRDLWLVKTVGVLVLAVGATLMLAGTRRSRAPEVPVLALGSAAGLGAIDVLYAVRGEISRIYFGDAVAQLVLIAAWVLALRRTPPPTTGNL